jgi:MtN3 and saliva related transmembrane protein
MLSVPPVEVLGLVAGFFGALCSIPQSIKIIKSRDASSVSLLTFCMLLISGSLWVIYGIMMGAVSIMLWNAVAAMFAIGTIFLKLTFKEKK